MRGCAPSTYAALGKHGLATEPPGRQRTSTVEACNETAADRELVDGDHKEASSRYRVILLVCAIRFPFCGFETDSGIIQRRRSLPF